MDDRVYQQLNSFLDQHFPYCAGKFGPGSADDATLHPCGDLLGEEGFSSTVGAWLARHPDVDKRAALSVWSMYYFSHLAISPVVLWLKFRHAVAASPEQLGLRLDATTGLPDTFTVRDPETPLPAATIHDAFAPLIFDHAAPLIAAFSRFGLSPRLLWSNLSVYVEWMVGEIGKMEPALGEEGRQLLHVQHWPDGRPNPLHGLLTRSCGDDGEDFTRRRVCCLRYLLPGVPGCGMICPLPAGRA